MIVDAEVCIVDATQEAAALFGFPSTEAMLGVHGTRLLAPHEHERATQLAVGVWAQGAGDRGPWTLLRADGSHFTAMLDFILLQREGAPPRVLLSVLDTTQHQRTTRALQDFQQQTQRLLDISGTMIVALDRQGQVVQINAEGARILGRAAEEIVGEDWFEHFLPQRLRSQVQAVAQQLFAGEIEPVRFHENPVLCADGTERTIFWHNTVDRDEHGAIIGLYSSGLDITERVQAERRRAAALELAEARHAELDSLLEAVRAVSAADSFEDAAQALLSHCTRATHASGGALITWQRGPTLDPLLTIRSQELTRTLALEHAAPSGSIQAHTLEQDATSLHNDFPSSPWAADSLPMGHTAIHSALFTPLRAGGAAMGLLGVVNKQGGFTEDDTRLLEGFAGLLGMGLATLRSRDALRISEQRHRSIFERAVNPIALLSLDGIILDCNPQVEDVFGYRVEQLRGQPATKLIHPDDHGRLQVDLDDIVDLETYHKRHYRAIHRAGHVMEIEVDAGIATLSGEHTEIVCQVADVSSRLRRERLERMSHRLLRISHERGSLSAIAQAFCAEVQRSTGCAAVAIRGRNADGTAPWIAQIGFPQQALGEDRGAFEKDSHGFGSLVTVPIRFGGSSLGLIQAASREPRSIPRDVLAVLDEAALQLGITMQRLDAEHRLQQQLAFQQEVLEAIPIPVYYKDVEGRMIGWNRAWIRSTGWKPAEVAGRHADQVLNCEDAALFREKDRELLDSPGRQVFEHSYTGPGGQRRDTVIHRATFSRGDESVGGIIGAIVDVTPLKQAAKVVEGLNRSLEGKVQARLEELQSLHRLSKDLAHTRNVPDLARATLHHLHEPMPSDLTALAICMGDRCGLFVRADRSLGDETIRALEQHLAAELVPLGIPHPPGIEPGSIAPLDASLPPVASLGSIYTVPLWTEDHSKVIGAILTAAEAEECFTENHVRLLQVAATQIAEAGQRVLLRRGADSTPSAPAPPAAADRAGDHHTTVEALLDRLPQLALLLDENHHPLHINRVAQQLLGLRPEQIRGAALRLCPIPWDWERLEPLLLPRALRSGGGRIPDLRFDHADGRAGVLDLHLLPLHEGEDRAKVLLLAEDVTQRRGLEARQQLARQMASIGQLASGIAHEINTPTQYVGDNLQFLGESFEDLRGLLDAVSAVLDGPDRDSLPAHTQGELDAAREHADLDYLLDEVPRAVQQAREGIRRIATIVGAMREFSHGGSREKTVVDINRCVRSTVTVARNEWKYLSQLKLELSENLPAIPTLAAELNQVLLNLLINAVHAIGATGPGEGGELGTITFRTQRVGDHIVISVQDDGCGIPHELQGRIFEPFFTTKPVGQGTGQGLAISHTIVVDKLGGQLVFESEPGIGSTFTIKLPASG